MTYGIPESGSYFKVPDDDIPDPFICHGCQEETDIAEMADPDRNDGLELCGWCAEGRK